VKLPTDPLLSARVAVQVATGLWALRDRATWHRVRTRLQGVHFLWEGSGVLLTIKACIKLNNIDAYLSDRRTPEGNLLCPLSQPKIAALFA
jgi:hypothetical protein